MKEVRTKNPDCVIPLAKILEQAKLIQGVSIRIRVIFWKIKVINRRMVPGIFKMFNILIWVTVV